MKVAFNENSYRAKQGMKFQNEIFEQLQKMEGISDLEMTWDYFNRISPGLEDKEYAGLEKENGDITFIKDGERYWIECCFILGKEYTYFCDLKRLKFKGENKFYCFGKLNFDEPAWFISASVWNRYVYHCETVKFEHRRYKKIKVDLIGSNIKAAIPTVENFIKII